jgi:hypothetical protein
MVVRLERGKYFLKKSNRRVLELGSATWRATTTDKTERRTHEVHSSRCHPGRTRHAGRLQIDQQIAAFKQNRYIVVETAYQMGHIDMGSTRRIRT